MIKKLTPMQEQYNQIKKDYADTIVFFRMGDFYEVFDEDAELVAKTLDITLTGKGKGENRQKMAGVPHHALQNYLGKLIKSGYKIAIADQMEVPKPGKLVERKITKIITPGTIADELLDTPDQNNFLSSFWVDKNAKGSLHYFLCYTDITTGVCYTLMSEHKILIKQELYRIKPAEIICKEADIQILENITEHVYIQKVDEFLFDTKLAKTKVISQYGEFAINGFGLDIENPLLIGIGALIEYIEKCYKNSLGHFRSIKVINISHKIQLDIETIRNLELIHSQNGQTDNSVFRTINKCTTFMGQRLLYSWLLNPLNNEFEIKQRQDSVEFFISNPIVLEESRKLLNHISDIERTIGRIGMQSISPKMLINFAYTIEQSLETINIISRSAQHIPSSINLLIQNLNFTEIEHVSNTIKKSIHTNSPANTSETGIIADGYNSEIDDLRSVKKNAKLALAKIQETEIERTGINSLKISFNKVFGYYIEITNTHKSRVPENYIRKQTLANAERYITPELKDLEEKILNSDELLLGKEQELYRQILSNLQNNIIALQNLSSAISEIDIYSTFAFIAVKNDYCRPIMSITKEMNVVDCRHIVIEGLVDEFISNSISFSEESGKIHIITGPNMSGKSTFIRQVAINSILAQIGCFIPAKKATMPIFDKVFTRVGASDNLSKGASTFMVEMIETANILNNATKNSLIILDEVGRGTSTYDGVAIAWSILEYIAEKLDSSTLFATHYHELIELEKKYTKICNYTVSIDETGDDIQFLHKIVPGHADKSYGIHVAKIAGMPNQIIDRSKQILFNLENLSPEKSETTQISPRVKKPNSEQLSLL